MVNKKFAIRRSFLFLVIMLFVVTFLSACHSSQNKESSQELSEAAQLSLHSLLKDRDELQEVPQEFLDIPVCKTSSQAEFLESSVKLFEQNVGVANILFEGKAPHDDEMLVWLHNVELNCAQIPSEAANISFKPIALSNNETLFLIKLKLPEDKKTLAEHRLQMMQEVHKVLDECNLKTGDKPTEENITKLVIALAERAQYDQRIAFNNCSVKDLSNRSAYGALVSGHTICNGYSRAFKLCADMLGWESWVVAATWEDQQHSFNQIYIPNLKTSKFADVTRAQHGENNVFFQSDNDLANQGVVIKDFSVAPWERR